MVVSPSSAPGACCSGTPNGSTPQQSSLRIAQSAEALRSPRNSLVSALVRLEELLHMQRAPLPSVEPVTPLIRGEWSSGREGGARRSRSRSSQARGKVANSCRSSQAGVKVPIHLGDHGMPVVRDMTGAVALDGGIVQWGREEGPHTVPGHLRQGFPLL
eukprot:4271725-Amphidinium_carterae.3